MNDFIALRKDEDNVDAAMKKFDPDFGCFSLGRYETLFVETMKAAMNDTNDWISYWCYELTFGKDVNKQSVTDTNGKCFPIKTLDNLFDLINNKHEL